MGAALGHRVGVGGKVCASSCTAHRGSMLLPWEQTIFEINATSRTPASTVMRSKRRHDRVLIEKYQRGQQEKRAAALQGRGLCPAPLAPQEGEGEGEEEENLQVMRMRSLAVPGFGGSCSDCQGVMAPPSRALSSPRTCSPPSWARSENGAEEVMMVPGKRRGSQRSGTRTSTSRTGPRTLRARGGEFGGVLLPSCSALHVGAALITPLCRLSVGGEGSPFEQQAAGAVLDLMGDENHNLNKSKQLLKW